MSRTATALLVLAKAPEPGLVKTRLCPPADPVGAARIAAAALLDTLDAVFAVPGARVVVALSGDIGRAQRSAELSAALRGATVFGQRGDGLAERIAAAHEDTAAAAPGLPVVQIGMDTPQVGAELLDSAARRLADSGGADAVLGLATDGGWWALGLRDPLHAKLIPGVPMSTSATGSGTADALREAGLTVGELPVLSDVDTAEDAHTVAAAIPGGRFAAEVREVLGCR